MSRILRSRGAGALIALVAVALVATGGSAVAASLVTGKQIKNGTITLKDINKKARGKLEGDRGPQGAQGPQGPQGEPGPATGAAGGALAGSYPNPALAPEIDQLTPVAAFAFAGGSGTVNAEAHRAPVTAAPVVTREGAGDYVVELPGTSFHTAADVANCTTSDGLTVAITSSGGKMLVMTRDTGDALTDPSRVRCVVYDLG